MGVKDVSVEIKKYRVSQLKPGMKLGRDIIKNDTVLYPKNNIVSDSVISYLKKWDIEEVYILEEKEEVRVNRERRIKRLKQRYNTAVDRTAKFMYGLLDHGRLDVKEVNELAEDLYCFAFDNYDLIKHLDQLQDSSWFLFQHSVNVGIYSFLLAKWMGLDEKTIKEIGLCGLLHDLGRVYYEKNILKNFNKHPGYGYEILRRQTKYNIEILKGIYQHHERLDGSGYPDGIKGDLLSTYARVISVVDMFDELIIKKPDHLVRDVKSGEMNVFYAIELIKEEAYRSLDPYAAKVFVNRMLDLLVGVKVLLSDKNVGEVIMINKDKPGGCLVRIRDKFIDLNKESALKIEKVLTF